jgi:farnesyl-diphosphate farnesyltransferase
MKQGHGTLPSTQLDALGMGTEGMDLADRSFQSYILKRVSRTFALTIPELPPRLAEIVGNAYLLCRIADTIEDDPDLDLHEKLSFAHDFADVVSGAGLATALASALGRRLSLATPVAERELIAHMDTVVRRAHSYTRIERAAVTRCVRVMTNGMAVFQCKMSPRGLANLTELDRYCYHVAGIVGEMLTHLFCEHSPAIARREASLMAIAASFGQGLQMTNILKDVWEDLSRGVCWLPRDHFAAHGFDLDNLGSSDGNHNFHRGIRSLVALASRHLADALDYTLLLPASEPGIRRFCLWALGIAMLTLRKVHARPQFRSGQEVKVSRRAVRATVLATSLWTQNDNALRLLFQLAERGLPSRV